MANERQLYVGEGQYEFTPAQNDQITRLANSMRWVSLPMFVLGILCAVDLVINLVWLVQTRSYQDWHAVGNFLMLLFTTLLFLAFAFWTSASARDFQKITETRGQDISHLMSALDGLRKVYSVIATFVKIFIAIMVLSLILSLVWAFSDYRQKQIAQPEPAPANRP
jgi:H+/Cl- antiporter ClcA